eukprot:8785774-Karenia_brevis.AAC.1
MGTRLGFAKASSQYQCSANQASPVLFGSIAEKGVSLVKLPKPAASACVQARDGQAAEARSLVP